MRKRSMTKIKRGEEKQEVSRRKRRRMIMDRTTGDEMRVRLNEFMSEYREVTRSCVSQTAASLGPSTGTLRQGGPQLPSW